MNQKLFSIILFGRNDNYGGFFIKRLELCINYFVYSSNKIPKESDYEIIVVDWNSEEPLSEKLKLSPEACEVTKFISVPPETAQKYNPDNQNIHVTLAVNFGIERANGKYFIVMPGDMLFTMYSIDRLHEVLSKKNALVFDPLNSVMTIKRLLIPYEFKETDRTFAEIDRYLLLSHNWLSENFVTPGICADVGAIVCSKDIWREVGGFDEDYHGWGKSDSRFGLTANINYPSIELSGFGICSYDPSIDNNNLQAKLKLINPNKNIEFELSTVRPGAPCESVDIQKSAPHCDYKEENTARDFRFIESFKGLFSTELFKKIKSELPFNSISVSPVLYPLYWYSKSFNVHYYCEIVSSEVSNKWQSNDITLESQSVTALLSAINPSAEIFTILPESKTAPKTTDFKCIGKEYLNKKSGELSFVNTILREVMPSYEFKHKWNRGFTTATHHGIINYILGYTDQSISKLKKRLPESATLDLVVFRVKEFINPVDVFCQVTKLLSSNGMIIIEGCSKTFIDDMEELTGDSGMFLKNLNLEIVLYFPFFDKDAESIWERNINSTAKLWKNKYIISNLLLSKLYSFVKKMLN